VHGYENPTAFNSRRLHHTEFRPDSDAAQRRVKTVG
jgi:hypothetical protein